MNVLVACEFSGIVRDAFTARGHYAESCDIVPSETPGPHYQGDVLDILGGRSNGQPWDLMIAHPPCTYLSNSGAKHLYLGMKKENGPNPERWQAMWRAVYFFQRLLDCNIPRIAVENPVMLGYALDRIGELPDQIIQPWEHGHAESKATCLWLKGLSKLTPSDLILTIPKTSTHRMPPGPNRGRNRSRTFPGIAEAMAAQWGGAA